MGRFECWNRDRRLKLALVLLIASLIKLALVLLIASLIKLALVLLIAS